MLAAGPVEGGAMRLLLVLVAAGVALMIVDRLK